MVYQMVKTTVHSQEQEEPACSEKTSLDIFNLQQHDEKRKIMKMERYNSYAKASNVFVFLLNPLN